MSRGQSQRSQRRPLDRCKSKGKANDVIDVDGDEVNDFIIIDPPESLERTSSDVRIHGKDKISVQSNIIYIDDDDDDERGYASHRQNGAEEVGNQDLHFASHGRSDTALDEDDDSNSDIVEDYTGNIRQQWQEASLKRKIFENVQKGQFGSQDLEGTTGQEICDETFVCKNTVAASNAFPDDTQNYDIRGREMLKETNAYKRAEEEEWASRQRELQNQSKEAQLLRKRRKAQTQRLLEMERRQKQRVEEVREANKKDKEILDLKEQLRIEVRRELHNLEANCRDMASLLRRLGISVGGGLYPSSLEVRAGYKQALLKFHPDRASSSSMHEQIEAEEKFKLISRAKEKFMLT